MVERVADRAVDLRHAAQRVRVLDLVRSAVVALLEARCRAAGGAARRRRRPGPGAAGRAGRPRRTRRPCPSSASTLIAAATLAVRDQPVASARRSAPIAPIIWVPLSSARPSFGLERRAAPGPPRAARAAPARPSPSSSTWPRPMSGSARWASGARSPDAPTAALLRHDRVDRRARRKSSSRSTSSGRQPLWPSARVFARSSEHRPDDLARERRPDARGVAHQEVLLEPRGVAPAGSNVVARSPNPVVTP